MTGIFFMVLPALSVFFGVEMVVGVDGPATMLRRLTGVPLILLGLPFLYLDWVYVRRPVHGDE